MSLSLAEAAFVGAVVTTMELQAEILALHEKLDVAYSKLANSNRAVLQDQGFNDSTPPDEVLAAQRRYMEAAIKQSGFGEDEPVVKVLRQQLAETEEAYAAYQQAEAAKLGKIRGPVL